MDIVGVIAMFVGSWLMYEAVVNKQPTPIKTATGQLQKSGGSTTTTKG